MSIDERAVRDPGSGEASGSSEASGSGEASGSELGVQPPHSRFTRRRFLRGAGAAAGLATLGGGALGLERLLTEPRLGPRIHSFPVRSGDTAQAYRSLPGLNPATVTVSRPTDATGYLFLTPGAQAGAQPGPLIVDNRGEPVWFKPLASNLWASNARMARHQGKTVLSWWEGSVLEPGYGKGEGVLMDSSYRELARVQAAAGRQADLHEFLLTPDGTALLTCYPAVVHADLSSVGGPKDGTVLESVVQEVDISTGRLLFEWRSLDHIPLSESYRPMEQPYDYLHVNSVGLTPDGNLLVSARHTWALYKLQRETGQVMWRLGGKRSDFAMARGAQFSWQHDARQVNDSTITVFDDGSDGTTNTESQSRGLVLDVDSTRRTVKVRHSLRHPRSLLTVAMGSLQTLSNGDFVVGWGTEPYLSEFSGDGGIAGDLQLPSGQQSYRALRFDWAGRPSSGPPALAVSRDRRSGKATLYASWNGATDVRHWRVHLGPTKSHQGVLGVARRRGFETGIPVGSAGSYGRVSALDASGKWLGHSQTIRL